MLRNLRFFNISKPVCLKKRILANFVCIWQAWFWRLANAQNLFRFFQKRVQALPQCVFEFQVAGVGF